MKKQKIIFSGILLLLSVNFIEAQTPKPNYAGHIEFAKGGFGTFDGPQKGDSILVYVKDSSINFQIFPPAAPAQFRSIEISLSDLKLVKKKMYEDIISPTEKKASGNYDMKFGYKSGKKYSTSPLYLTHFGNGDIAELTLVIEHDGVRVDDLFSATLVKLK